MKRSVATVLALLGAGLVLALWFVMAAFGSSASTAKYTSTLGTQAEIPKPKGASANAGATFS